MYRTVYYYRTVGTINELVKNSEYYVLLVLQTVQCTEKELGPIPTALQNHVI